MTTDSQGTAIAKAATAKLKQDETDLAALRAQVSTLTTSGTASAATLAQAQADLAAAVTRSNALLAQVTDLQSQLSTQTALTAEFQAALEELNAQLAGGTTTPPPVVVPPPVVLPPTADDAVIQAALTDSSLAGINNRLGADSTGLDVSGFPDVWTRPEVPTTDMGFSGGASSMGTYSQGLSITAAPAGTGPKPGFDYGSTEVGIIAVDDKPFLVNPTNPAAVNSDGGPGPQGVGLYRQRTEEHAEGMVRLMPRTGYNAAGSDFPDMQAVAGHTASYGMGNKLGNFIDVIRGRINRYDAGFALADKTRGGTAYIGTIPTQTAWSPWSGVQLNDNFIPLCLGLSSQNEFLYVGVHDKATNSGKLVIIVNWGGFYQKGKEFAADFMSPHPGLLQSGVVIGMKVIGTVDLPIKWPTSLSVATARNTGSDRIEGPDGNAAGLSTYDVSIPGWRDTYDLSTQAGRNAFLAKNGGWVPTWGKIVIASKPENKVVQLDATALYQAYRDQYFTTQANYDVTRPQNPGGAWYQIYDYTNAAVWPYILPAWVPTVTRVLDVARPTVAWMLETNNGAFVIGCEDGNLRWFKDDGTVDGTLQLGPNITSIKDGKYKGGVRLGDILVVSRGARSVYGVHGKQVNYTIQDVKLLDPVDAEEGDTHGIETRFIDVLSFADKKIWSYRNTKLVMATQGGVVIGTGPTAEADRISAAAAIAAGNTPNPPVEQLECTGSRDLPGHGFKLWGSNVN